MACRMTYGGSHDPTSIKIDPRKASSSFLLWTTTVATFPDTIERWNKKY